MQKDGRIVHISNGCQHSHIYHIALSSFILLTYLGCNLEIATRNFEINRKGSWLYGAKKEPRGMVMSGVPLQWVLRLAYIHILANSITCA